MGLEDEAYFRYFSYPDFLTRHSGLVQLRKYAGDARRGGFAATFLQQDLTSPHSTCGCKTHITYLP